DGTLLTAMKNAGQELDDEDLAAYMKQRGLGTPATRAAIIERLIKTGYIYRDKKKLMPTEKGTALIGQVHHDLKDVALTANWEQSLADMQDGKILQAKFENDIGDFVRRLLPEVIKQSPALPFTSTSDRFKNYSRSSTSRTSLPAARSVDDDSSGDAELSAPVTGRRKAYGSKTGGGTRKTSATSGSAGGTKSRKGTAKSGYGTGKSTGTTKSRGTRTTGAGGKTGSSRTSKSDSNETTSAKPPGTGRTTNDVSFGPCPQCHRGFVRQTPKGAGCSYWRDGCTFTIWRECFGKKLTDTQIKDLVRKKRTSMIKGFKKKSGDGTYEARLVLNEEFKARLEFQ
ncbi:MAG: topoisomerase C-terminal repeat-containing protein, partial [Cyanobacteria bacterium]|nr:topoisomerase C-terminal repeat-containing protein [Cyanobacteriota bacterium]